MHILHPIKHQARCWQSAFCFPEGGATAQVCSLFFARKPWSTFWSCSLASYQILLFLWLSLATCTGSWPQRGGGCVWNAVCCQCPQARVRDLQERFSLWFVVSLHVGVQNAVRRNHVSVVPSGNLVRHSLDLLLLISCWAPNLTLWMLWERNKPSEASCTAEKAGHPLSDVPFPCRRNLGPFF